MHDTSGTTVDYECLQFHRITHDAFEPTVAIM